MEASRKVEDVAREVGVSKDTLYGWKAKYGVLEVCEVNRGAAGRSCVVNWLRERYTVSQRRVCGLLSMVSNLRQARSSLICRYRFCYLRTTSCSRAVCTCRWQRLGIAAKRPPKSRSVRTRI